MTCPLLAIETSSDACSAALLIGNQYTERFCIERNRHSERLLPMIEDLLTEAKLTPQDLQVVALGAGPGSFTGLRIGAGVAHGLAIGSGARIVSVSSLAALASAHCQKLKSLMVAIDARMGEVYYAAYHCDAKGTFDKHTEAQIIAPANLDIDLRQDWLFVGNAWEIYRQQWPATIRECLDTSLATDTPHYPRARHIATLAPLKPIPELAGRNNELPQYVRNTVAVRQP